ncbi:hypothetical protein [Chitinibacter tainanensis]|uniref:hypothetical protein n=1 Tax=Chitinibacter tainanensis TaxID=230667 RepID=UPI0003F9973C|nr:hypothetical protein [Chitinibacter tainanensis]
MSTFTPDQIMKQQKSVSRALHHVPDLMNANMSAAFGSLFLAIREQNQKADMIEGLKAKANELPEAIAKGFLGAMNKATYGDMLGSVTMYARLTLANSSLATEYDPILAVEDEFKAECDKLLINARKNIDPENKQAIDELAELAEILSEIQKWIAGPKLSILSCAMTGITITDETQVLEQYGISAEYADAPTPCIGLMNMFEAHLATFRDACIAQTTSEGKIDKNAFVDQMAAVTREWSEKVADLLNDTNRIGIVEQRGVESAERIAEDLLNRVSKSASEA